MGDEPGMEEKVQTEGAPKTALYLRMGTAFRWRPVAQTAESSDVIRVIEEGDLKVIVLANAYDCGFAVCWPPGSRLVLDCFEHSWASATGTLELPRFSGQSLQMIAVTPRPELPSTRIGWG